MADVHITNRAALCSACWSAPGSQARIAASAILGAGDRQTHRGTTEGAMVEILTREAALSNEDRLFLQTVEDDTEEAPWMVMGTPQA